jgi:hypothetical protein
MFVAVSRMASCVTAATVALTGSVRSKMKKKPRIGPSNPYYSSEPAVSRKKMASQAPVPSANLANKPPKSVNQQPAKMSGTAGFVDKGGLRKTPSKIEVPKLGSKSGLPLQGKRARKN